MNQHTQYNDVKDFLFHPDLQQIVDIEDETKVNDFIKNYPDKNIEIRDALLLLKHLKIEEVPVSQIQIDIDFEQLMSKIKFKKQLRLWIAASVACATLLFGIVYFMQYQSNQTHNTTIMQLALLDSLESDSDEIEIIAGNTQMYFENNDQIEQTQEGDIKVGEKKKISNKNLISENIHLIVPYGKRASLKLSDGTIIHVNSGSRLIYPKTFAKNKREIFINGEAYLDVAKDAERPFHVHSYQFDVVVLGTSFNICSYKSDAEGSVVLAEGSVNVKTNNAQTENLIPNQGLFYKEGEVNIKKVDPSYYSSWKDGVMSLNGETLASIFRRLARYYKLDIVFQESIAKERYKGKLNLDEPIEEVLKNLAISTQFEYLREKDTIYIK